MLVSTNGGLLAFLDWLRTQLNAVGPTIRLFKNDHTPAFDDTAANFTEADFGGYAAITLNAMALPVINDDAAYTLGPVLTWTRTSGSNTIYGYFVTDGSGNLLWAERRPSGPRTIDGTNTEYKLQPRLRLRRDETE